MNRHFTYLAFLAFLFSLSVHANPGDGTREGQPAPVIEPETSEICVTCPVGRQSTRAFVPAGPQNTHMEFPTQPCKSDFTRRCVTNLQFATATKVALEHHFPGASIQCEGTCANPNKECMLTRHEVTFGPGLLFMADRFGPNDTWIFDINTNREAGVMVPDVYDLGYWCACLDPLGESKLLPIYRL